MFSRLINGKCQFIKIVLINGLRFKTIHCVTKAYNIVLQSIKCANKAISRLTKMYAKAPTCFNFFNFHPVSTKFPINIEHVILTNRMFFVFQIATFLAGK